MDRNSCCLLERLLLDYLEAKILPTDELDVLLKEYIYWPTMDQYYYIPILMVFVKDVILNTFRPI